MVPTLQELAGITMLALVTTALLVFPSSGQPRETPAKSVEIPTSLSIDGVETIPLLSERARQTEGAARHSGSSNN